MLSAIAGACLCVFVNVEIMFGTFCLELKHAVQVKKFPNEIKLPVFEHVLRGADLRVHAYYASSSGFAGVCHRLS